MLEGQLEANILKKEVEQTASVYQSSHSILLTLLELRLDEHTCMELSIRLEQVMLTAHLFLCITTMCSVLHFSMRNCFDDSCTNYLPIILDPRILWISDGRET